MKKLSVIILSVMLTISAFAQKRLNPPIKTNTVVNYILTENNKDVPLAITFISVGDPLKITWKTNSDGSGSYEMPARALQSGKVFSEAKPAVNAVTKLSDEQTAFFISKEVYSQMQKTQMFTYNGIKFKVAVNDTQAFTVKERLWDVTHAVAVQGDAELWILNNPDFPLICKTKNNANGMDVSIVGVE
jgi:hypothetical protein